MVQAEDSQYFEHVLNQQFVAAFPTVFEAQALVTGSEQGLNF